MTIRSSLHPQNEINNNSDKQCMIIFNHLYNKLLPYLLCSIWEHRHGALLKHVNINGGIDKKCDNIFIEGCLICLSALLLHDIKRMNV